MAERPEIPDELLVDMLNERGYTVEKRQESDLADLADLAAKVDAVEQRIAETREAPASPEDVRLKFATELRDRLNANMSKWYEPGGSDAA
jgi:hypothetical protein